MFDTAVHFFVAIGLMVTACTIAQKVVAGGQDGDIIVQGDRTELDEAPRIKTVMDGNSILFHVR